MEKHSQIPGDIQRKAFDKFDVLGNVFRDYLIEEIERQGIVFDYKHHYRLQEIEE